MTPNEEVTLRYDQLVRLASRKAEDIISAGESKDTDLRDAIVAQITPWYAIAAIALQSEMALAKKGS